MTKPTIHGKGMYLWLMNRSEKPAEIAWLAKQAGLGHLLIKIADGTVESEGNIADLVGYLHQEGIQAFGWQYIYTGSLNEADAAVRLCRVYDLDGFIVNAESQFDRTGMDDAARSYMTRLRGALGGDYLIGLSSYRYPTAHRNFPWRVFLEFCDVNMPQVYWLKEDWDNAPIRNIEGCLADFKKWYEFLGFSRPIVMTGAAFSEHGWVATPIQVENFLRVVDAVSQTDPLVMPACNFWEWWEARTENPTLWPVIAQYPWRYIPMSDFDIWASDVTEALRSQGHTISDPPSTSTPPPANFRMRFDKTVNLRDKPAGLDIGDVTGIVTIRPPLQKIPFQGKWYDWGEIVEPSKWAGGWVATDLGVRL